MVEEDAVRMDWAAGMFRKESTHCGACGEQNVWDKVHQCFEDQCKGMLNALQHFPSAAWDDISAAPLDPVKVTPARKLEIEFVEKKPVSRKIGKRNGLGNTKV